MSQNLNILDLFWPSEVQLRQSVVEMWLECTRVLHELLLILVLMYCSEIIYGWRKRGLYLWLYKWTTSMFFLRNKTMDKIQNARKRELCGVTKPVDKRIDEWVM